MMASSLPHSLNSTQQPKAESAHDRVDMCSRQQCILMHMKENEVQLSKLSYFLTYSTLEQF